MKIFIALIFCSLFAVPAAAQTHYQLGAGMTNILDTYLSQEKFHGTGISFLSTRDGAGILPATVENIPSPELHGPGVTLPAPKRWTTQWQHQVHLSKAKDRADDASLLEAMYKVYFGRYCRLTDHKRRLQLFVGGQANLGLGVIYDTRNGNNPVQARLGLHLMPTAKATYPLQLFRHTARLRYQLDLPLFGLVFSPNYGQSYYELFSLGNYDHNIVPTTFVSAPNFRQQLALLYDVSSRLTLSIGYLGDYQQQHVNNLKQHVYDHSFLIGIARNL